jgi:ABC-type oligopeptide transport system substrate-binding subunit
VVFEPIYHGDRHAGDRLDRPEFDAMVSQANRTRGTARRLEELSQCEKRLLQAMPVIPLYRDLWCYLEKPYVRGLASNLIDARRFKYAWIDTNWRPS